ncbi:MAG: hypothetical protein ABR587_03475 [Candidatus Binatia bacterium]
MTRAGAIAAGAALFALPFLQSGVGDDHGGPMHMDHAAHHGGSLLMLGNNHLEIVEGADDLELYVSDDARRPVRPIAASIAFDDGAVQQFHWSTYRMTVSKPEQYAWADYRITLADAPALSIRLPATGITMPQ